jgi:hypothetical protein
VPSHRTFLLDWTVRTLFGADPRDSAIFGRLEAEAAAVPIAQAGSPLSPTGRA